MGAPTKGLPPSIDPAQRRSLFGMIQFIIDKMVKQDMDNRLPCKVIATDGRQNAQVQIMVNMLDTTGKQVTRAQIASVPVGTFAAGGFLISMPVTAGDLGWIEATDTDMSMFLQAIKQGATTPQPPNTKIMHKFDSSIFRPDCMFAGVTIAGGDAGKLIIQNKAGTCKLVCDGTNWDFTVPGGGKVRVNGVNIGDTHVHGGVTVGSGNTAVPH